MRCPLSDGCTLPLVYLPGQWEGIAAYLASLLPLHPLPVAVGPHWLFSECYSFIYLFTLGICSMFAHFIFYLD